MQSVPAVAVPKIQLMVVQATPFCNIDCKYCYLPDRRSKAVVSTDTLTNLFTQIFDADMASDDDFTVIWHAGEPMVLPVDFYREAFRLVDRLKPAGLRLTHSFQTNGTLITDEWCDFFRSEKINLGVSIDGPKRFHDRNRLTRSGLGTFDKTIAGIRRLRRNDVPFHVISVLSTDSLAAPREMFDFYIDEGIDQVCFNVEESEGDHVSEAFAGASPDVAYYHFLDGFWKASTTAPGKIKFIREIEHALRLIVRPKEVGFGNQLVEPFAITSMDCFGNVSTFSPELLGLKNERYSNFIIGNVNRERLADMVASPVLALMQQDIQAGVAMCRESCEYFSVCGGGEPVNKLAENGTFVSGETTYCRMTKMRVTDLILDALDRVQPGSLPPGAGDSKQTFNAIGIPAL
jgi:uncharacterized protein